MGTAQGFRELWGKAFFLLLLTVAAWPAYAATWYVAPDGSGGGTSWQDAGALQATVNAASTGDEVWVAAGTYTAATDPVLTMKAGVALYGGFSGTESERDQRDWTAQVTTIDGEDMRRCVIGANDAVLDGFVITRGTSDFRGGMYNDNASPTVTNCTFTGNTSSGMHNSTSSPTVTNCTFTENSRHGMDNDYSSPTVTNCTFTGNSRAGMTNYYSSSTVTNCTFTGNSDDGMYNKHASPTVTNCTFTGNHWGMLNSTSSPTVTNCTFTENSDDGMYNIDASPTVTNCIFTGNGGYGMDNGSDSSPTVTNCTFTGNSGGMKNQFNASPTVTNCIIWGNGATGISEINGVPSVTYSCVRGGISGEGNIDVDPMLLAAPGKPKIHPHSPCIDAGTSDGAPDTDIMGNPRPQGAGVDMGAYEGGANEDLVVLTINTSPADMGRTTPPKGLYCFERGDTVLITAQDMFGLFKNWSGDVSGDTREISVVMDVDKTATAVFDENIYYVKADSTAESPDGRSWESAYATLQEAVDRAGEDGGCSIWATAGLYTSAAANVLYMKERVSVFGGFSGVETELDQRDWKNNPTVIDGESMRRCVHGADVTLLDGLHIVNGFVYEANGGGISNDRAETQVMNCIFTNL